MYIIPYGLVPVKCQEQLSNYDDNLTYFFLLQVKLIEVNL